jgi:hypothetical protein
MDRVSKAGAANNVELRLHRVTAHDASGAKLAVLLTWLICPPLIESWRGSQT